MILVLNGPLGVGKTETSWALVRHHHAAGVPHLVVNWVFETPVQLAALAEELETLQRPVHCYRLVCDPEEHEARIRARGPGRSAAEVPAELERGRELARILDGVTVRAALGHPVDTTRKSVVAVAEVILRHARSTPASSGDGQ